MSVCGDKRTSLLLRGQDSLSRWCSACALDLYSGEVCRGPHTDLQLLREFQANYNVLG